MIAGDSPRCFQYDLILSFSAILSIVSTSAFLQNMNSIRTTEDQDPFSINTMSRHEFLNTTVRRDIESKFKDTPMSFGLGLLVSKFVSILSPGLGRDKLFPIVDSVIKDWVIQSLIIFRRPRLLTWCHEEIETIWRPWAE